MSKTIIGDGKTTTIKVGYHVKLPSIPNYLIVGDNEKIHISVATEESLREIGRLWTEELVRKSKQKEIL